MRITKVEEVSRDMGIVKGYTININRIDYKFESCEEDVIIYTKGDVSECRYVRGAHMPYTEDVELFIEWLKNDHPECFL